MQDLIDKVVAHPAIAIGGAVLWGLLEFFALLRVRRSARRRARNCV